MREIVMDTETTGLDPYTGHRIVEIGAVELLNHIPTGSVYHQYINPQRDMPEEAFNVHGLSEEFLSSKPMFADIAQEFLKFIDDGILIIHNAPFDIGFLDAELRRVDERHPGLEQLCRVTDTLVMARKRHPGQRNNLDALCGRYTVDNSQRDLHGALLDAEILADVYLAMTGGQTTFQLADHGPGEEGGGKREGIQRLPADRKPLPVIVASADELAAHEAQLEAIERSSGGRALWREVFPA